MTGNAVSTGVLCQRALREEQAEEEEEQEDFRFSIADFGFWSSHFHLCLVYGSISLWVNGSMSV